MIIASKLWRNITFRTKPILTTPPHDVVSMQFSLHNQSTELDELSRVIADVSEDEHDSGICKVQYIYSEDDPNSKKITAKQKGQMKNVSIYGMNPGNIRKDNKDVVSVDTELPGGDDAARECFKNLTGRYPTGIEDDFKIDNEDGPIILYRAAIESSSGHPKVEIHDHHIEKLLEKITFK